jgi:protoporphyrinogen oxidase
MLSVMFFHIADNWIYIHDPSVKVGRVQNYKSWSPEMVPDGTGNDVGGVRGESSQNGRRSEAGPQSSWLSL